MIELVVNDYHLMLVRATETYNKATDILLLEPVDGVTTQEIIEGLDGIEEGFELVLPNGSIRDYSGYTLESVKEDISVISKIFITLIKSFN